MTRQRQSFSNGSKDPSFGKGLDWDRVRADYEARLQANIDRKGRATEPDEIAYLEMKSGKKPKAPEAIPDAPKKASGPKRTRSDSMDHLRPKMVELYVEFKLPVREISHAMNISHVTVIRHLTKAGVYDPGRDMPQKKIRCNRGHDLSDPDKRIERADGGLTCKECLAINEQIAAGINRTLENFYGRSEQ